MKRGKIVTHYIEAELVLASTHPLLLAEPRQRGKEQILE
jgi:hypothetical protein